MSYESFLEDSVQRTLVVSSEGASDSSDVEIQVFRAPGWGKRALDLVISIPLVIFLLPLLIVIAVLVRFTDGSPAVFTHRRRGRNGKMFNCYKFRSMVKDADKQLEILLRENPDMAAEWERDQKLRHDPRITRLGRILRKSSLDELPQLVNIIRGDMSIVGPRPIVENEVERYGDFIVAYDSVKPGVTGLWQVTGRNNTSYDERVALDTRYAETYSLWGDIKILFKTVPAILFSRGAY